MEPGKDRKSPDEMTFLEHLEDLRKRLFNSAIALIIAFIPSWIFAKQIFAVLAKPVTKYLPVGTKLAFTHLVDPFMLYMKVGFLAATFIASPFIFLQFWYFIAPGLYQKERKYVVPFVILTTLFFAIGAAFGYFIVFPFACRFFLQMGGNFQPVISIEQYFGFSLRVLLGIAATFELPTLIYFLARMGIVTAKWMLKNFKYAVLAIFIIAAIITPTPDWVTQSVVAIPMIALYGIGILIALIVGKQRARDKASKETPAG